MALGHSAPAAAAGSGRPTTMLACMAGNRSVSDVGFHPARGLVGSCRPRVRRQRDPLGLSEPEVKGGEALDAAGGLASYRYGSDVRMQRFGAAVLQRYIPGVKDRPKAVPPDSKHEASKPRLGWSAPVSSHGGTQRFPSANHSGSLATFLGSGRGVFSFDAASRDNSLLWSRVPAGTVREGPGVHIRVGAIDVLRKQAVRDFQATQVSGGNTELQSGLTSTTSLQRSHP